MGDQNCMERTCPECGQLMVRDEARPFTIHYKGLSATFPMPGFYCVNCGEGVHTGKDMDVSDRNFNLLKAQAENLLSPMEVRRICKKLRLNQETAGQILGGGPNAFHKYETRPRPVQRGLGPRMFLPCISRLNDYFSTFQMKGLKLSLGNCADIAIRR